MVDYKWGTCAVRFLVVFYVPWCHVFSKLLMDSVRPLQQTEHLFCRRFNLHACHNCIRTYLLAISLLVNNALLCQKPQHFFTKKELLPSPIVPETVSKPIQELSLQCFASSMATYKFLLWWANFLPQWKSLTSDQTILPTLQGEIN